MIALGTTSTDYEKLLSTDATDTSFPSKIPTTTEPTGDAVVDLRNTDASGGIVQNLLNLLPIGTGANNAVLTGMRVLGWRMLPGSSTVKALWIPVVLGEFAAVFGNVTGVTGAALGTTYFFMDTITQVTGTSNVSNEIVSPTGDVIAHIQIDAKGFPKVEITFDLGASATGMNCLVAKM